jgi:hypothetical protein
VDRIEETDEERSERLEIEEFNTLHAKAQEWYDSLSEEQKGYVDYLRMPPSGGYSE